VFVGATTGVYSQRILLREVVYSVQTVTAFSYSTEIQTRYRDIDGMGHVNNAVYASYLESARQGYYRDVIGERLDRVDTVVAHMEIEYEASIELEQHVEIQVAIEHLGNSSIVMRYEILADDDVAARAETTQVVIDGETGSAVPIPDSWRAKIESNMETAAE
jgi:acyl-CoA thioester hydrolase